MGIFSKIRRHAAVASADFPSMFKEVEIPPLPAAVTRLIAEINRPEPDINELVRLVSSAPGIAAKIVKTVNSSLFALRRPVTNVKQAVTLLGLHHIRSIALAYATMDGLPKPRGDLFDHEAFWTDSLLRAMLCRSLSKKRHGQQVEDAFTASLLADVAVPVLLSAWQEYYEPVIQAWKQGRRPLSEIEGEHFGWNHAQAGAWIVRSWDFPEEIVCYIGMHNLSWEKIREHGLEDTIVVPMALARIAPSVLRPNGQDSGCLFHTAAQWLSMSRAELVHGLTEVRESFAEIAEFFGLSHRNASRILDDLGAAAGPGDEGDER